MTTGTDTLGDETRRRNTAGGIARRLLATARAPARPHGEETPARRRDSLRPFVYLAAGLSFVAAQVHGWAMLEHLSEQPLEGLFFLAVAFWQGAYAPALLDRPRSVPLLVAGLGATIGLLLLLVVAHTVGLPLAGLDGHAHVHAQAETFDRTALAALIVESGLALALAAQLRAQAAAGKVWRRYHEEMPRP